MRLAVLLVALLLVLTGCASADARSVIVLEAWSLGTDHAPPSQVLLPAHLDLPRRPLRYTLSTSVDLAPELRGQVLTLAVPLLQAPVHLEVDGAPVPPLGGEAPAGYRTAGHHAFRLPPSMTDRAALHLVLHVDHGWTQSAWIDVAPRLSPTPDGDRGSRALRGLNQISATVASGTLVTVGAIYLALFLLARRRTPHGWFAIQAFCASYNGAFVLGLTAWLLGPLDITLEGVVACVAGLTGVHFTHAQFGLPRPSKAWSWAVVGVAIVAALTRGPFSVDRWLGPVTVAFLLAVIFHQLRLLASLVRARPRPTNATIILACWVVFSVFAIPDFMAWLGFGELFVGLRTCSLGLSIYAMLQSFALGREHILSLDRAEALNAELVARVELLAERQRQIEALNGELRRQIAERSRAFSESLARLAVLPGELSPKTVVAGRYCVVRPIGRGGMGSVVLVRRISDDRLFAMKMLHQQSSLEVVARLAREAEVVARLDHPGLVSVVDVGISERGELYLVMEYVAGKSLELNRGRFGQIAWALPVLRQIAAALSAIHAAGIVHRDLKPENVLLTEDDTVKIVDFGIASFGGLTPGPNLTRTGIIMGTPLYIAPELAEGSHEARPPSDVYAFGVLAYELLTGLSPFERPPVLTCDDATTWPRPVPLGSICELPDELARMLDRCFAVPPEERPTCTDLLGALGASLSAQVQGDNARSARVLSRAEGMG